MADRTTAPGDRTGFLAGWDWFWFSPRNPTTLGLIRIFTGLIVLYVNFSYSFRLMEYVHPKSGWMDKTTYDFARYHEQIFLPPSDWDYPREGPFSPPDMSDFQLSSGQYTWSVYFHLEDPAAIWAVHSFFLVAALLFTLGLWTRVTCVLTWIATIQYINRAQTMLFGMDSMIMLGLFYLMIGPSGAALSLDRWLAQWWERRRRGDPDYVLPLKPSVLANVAIRMMQIQFCLMYLAAGTSKLQGSAWWNGNALWGTFGNYEFAPFYLPFYQAALAELCRHRWLWELVMSGGAIFTLLLELGFPFLVWVPRLRWVMVCGAVLLHTGIGVIMGLTTFSLMMLTLVCAFIPSEAVATVLASLAALFRRRKPGPAVRTQPAPALSS